MKDTKLNVIDIAALTLVATRGDEVDTSHLPSFSAYKKSVRIVELDISLLGEKLYGLICMRDHGDGTYSKSTDFPFAMISQTPLEVIDQINSLDDNFVAWGFSLDELKSAAEKSVLIEIGNGYFG